MLLPSEQLSGTYLNTSKTLSTGMTHRNSNEILPIHRNPPMPKGPELHDPKP